LHQQIKEERLKDSQEEKKGIKCIGRQKYQLNSSKEFGKTHKSQPKGNPNKKNQKHRDLFETHI
jgi:hypothetical protein